MRSDAAMQLQNVLDRSVEWPTHQWCYLKNGLKVFSFLCNSIFWTQERIIFFKFIIRMIDRSIKVSHFSLSRLKPSGFNCNEIKISNDKKRFILCFYGRNGSVLFCSVLYRKVTIKKEKKKQRQLELK